MKKSRTVVSSAGRQGGNMSMSCIYGIFIVVLKDKYVSILSGPASTNASTYYFFYEIAGPNH